MHFSLSKSNEKVHWQRLANQKAGIGISFCDWPMPQLTLHVLGNTFITPYFHLFASSLFTSISFIKAHFDKQCMTLTVLHVL